MSDSNTALAAIREGTILFSYLEAPMGEIPTLLKENYLLQERGYGIFFLEMNTLKGVLTNKNIRRALAIAFDRNYIISNVIKMDQIPAGAFVTTGMKDYDGGDFRENGGNYIDVDNYQKISKKLKDYLRKRVTRTEKVSRFGIEKHSGIFYDYMRGDTGNV